MKKLLKFIVIFVFICGVEKQAYSQKNAEGTRTTLELYPSVIDIQIKDVQIFCLLTREEGAKWKILITEDRSIVDALRLQSSPRSHTFESLRIKKSMARKIWRGVKRANRDIDYKAVSPYKIFLLFNTSIRPATITPY